MRITKFGHACVRIEHDGRVLVLDPGGFTEPEAVDGADALLITHEHADHYDVERLRRTDAPILTIAAVAARLGDDAPDLRERTTVVAPGDAFEAAGLGVRAVGEEHAVIHPSFPGFANSGYVVTVGDQRVFHPGDSFELPGEPVDVFCLPVSAPWTKLAEVLDHAKAVAAPHTVAVHDRILSDVGLAMADDRVTAFLEGIGDYQRPADGADVSL